MTRLRRHATVDDEGTVLLLVLGLVVMAALLITVVIDVSALYLARRSLLAAADGAALAGAQAVDEERLYTGELGASLPLDPDRVDDVVRDYLAAAGLDAGVRALATEVTTDGTLVTVRLTARVELPVVNGVTPGAQDGVVVTASATARSAVLG